MSEAQPETVALHMRSLQRCAREAARTYVGTHWPSMETLRFNGLTSEFTEAGDGDRVIRRFLSTFSPEFVRDLLDRLDTALAASPLRDPEQRDGLDVAWLIERGQPEAQEPTVWWSVFRNWTTDANNAMRFSDRATCEAFIEAHSPIPSHHPRFGRAVEHGWITPSRPAEERKP